tara:strand:+ start:405 stop:578 length:174 start_codon:yes stop_codon:yes gene_type:complete
VDTPVVVKKNPAALLKKGRKTTERQGSERQANWEGNQRGRKRIGLEIKQYFRADKQD